MFTPLLLITAAAAAASTATQPVTGNLAPNPGLEQISDATHLPAGWSPFTAWGKGRADVDDHVTHAGRHAIRLTGLQPATQTFLRTAPIEVAPGERFYASAYVRTDHLAGDPGALVMADFLMTDGHSEAVARFAVAPTSADGHWTRIDGTITVPPHAKTMHFRVGMWNAQGAAWFDDVELKAITPLSCRIDLTSPRLTPAMTTLPITLINRAGLKSDLTATLTLGTHSTTTPISLNGQTTQHVTLPLSIDSTGSTNLTVTFSPPSTPGQSAAPPRILPDKQLVTIPPPAHLSPPIPTHRAIEDGPPTVDGELDLALPPALLADAKAHVELLDADHRPVATWDNSAPLKDGLNPFHLSCPNLPIGTYTLQATLSPVHHSSFTIQHFSRPFHVLHRADAETTLNDAGFLVHAGRAIFSLGIFNGAGKSPEMAAAGFTVQHAYNACDVVEGELPDDRDDAALDFLDRAQAAGLQCLFLIPRGYAFTGDWDAFRRRVRMFRNHPALLAWDEEEGLARGDLDLKRLAKLRQILREEDPHHPLMVGDARDEITNITDRATLFPADLMDLGMWWWYPIPPRPKGGSLLNGDDLTSGYELTPPTFLTRATTRKPIWVGLQSYKKEFDGARYPTPAEYRAQAYIAVIHGAKGLMWYGGSVDGGVFTAPPGESGWDALKSLARELHNLSDVLMAPSLDIPSFTPPTAAISLSLRKSPTRTVLLAANRDRRPQDVTVRMPITSGTVVVLGESRQVPVVDHLLRDHFDGYAVHVYQLPAGR